MADTWQRKRPPDEVPTPLAVAVSDFCRRAKSKPSATEVREALAMLGADDDFRVREVTDREPAATPLGPFALVDVVLGTAPELAARRQEVGYYDVARALAATRAQPAPTPVSRETATPPPLPDKVADRLASLLGPAAAQQKSARGKDKAPAPPTVSERIAPKKRLPTERVGSERVEEPAVDEDRPQPRGRFTRVDAPKQPAAALLSPDVRGQLETMIEQHPTRLSLRKALSSQFTGKKGPLELEDVQKALVRHGLEKRLYAKERELVVSTYTEHRGAAGRVAWALDLSASELKELIAAAGLAREVDEVRDRFRKEALASRNLKQRLDLVGRTKYLDDLGVKRKFLDQLAKDVRGLLREVAPGAHSLDELIQAAAKRNAVDATTLGRAVERLNLDEEFSKQLAGSPAATTH